MDCAGDNDFALSISYLRNLLPRGVPRKNLHYKKLQASARTRSCRLLNPIILEKEDQANPHKKRKKLHATMQSTSF